MDLDDLVSMIPGPATVHDAEGVLLAGNAEGLSLVAQLRTNSVPDAPWHPQLADSGPVELRREHDGSTSWVVAQSRIVPSAGSTVTVTTFLDSSERQSWARSIMEEFVGRFRMSWARSGLPVFLVGVDGNDAGIVLATNAAAADLFGCAVDDLEDTPLSELFSSSALAQVSIGDHLQSLSVGETTSSTILADLSSPAAAGSREGQVQLGLTSAVTPSGRPLFILGYAVDQAPLHRAEALRQREFQRSALIHRHSSDAVVVIAADGTVEWIGPSMDKLLGFDRTSPLGTNVLELVHPDDHGLAIEALTSTATRPGTAAPLRLRTLDAHGNPRAVEVIATNLIDDPSVAGIVLNIRDRTGEAEAAAQIADRERRYRRIVDLAFDGIAQIDGDLRITYANERLCEILRRPLSDLTGARALDLVSPAETPQVAALFSTDMTSRFDRYPITLIAGDGSAVPALISAAPQGDDGDSGIVAWVSDVSETERTRSELRWSEARLHALLGALPDLIFRLAADGTYLDYHCSDPGLLVMPPEQFLGRRIADILPDEIAPGIAQLYQDTIDAVLESGSVHPVRYELEVADGLRQFEARVTALGSSEVLAVIRDVSDLHHSERQRAEQEQALIRTQQDVERAEIERELERATRLEAVGHLAATVAHDVNNLLGVVNNYSAAIQRRAADDEVIDDARAIERAVARGAELTQRLLRIGKGDAADTRDASLRSVLEDLRPTLERLFDGGAGTTFEMQLPEQECRALISRSRIEQAVINLVLNARDAYSDNGRHGTVAVEVHQTDNGDPHGESGPTRWTVVSVKDHAGGVPPTMRDRLFEPFVSTKGSGGSGLGLSIVQRVAVHHGGTVRVVDTDGGTTVELWLPCSTNTQRRPELPSGNWTVLVVDDDPDLRSSSTRLLDGFGCDTLAADSLDEALELLDQSPVDLVLSDVRMPGGTGPDLVRAVRLTGRTVPIVLMTGFPDELPDSPDLIDVPVITKPFAAMELFAIMSRSLA